MITYADEYYCWDENSLDYSIKKPWGVMFFFSSHKNKRGNIWASFQEAIREQDSDLPKEIINNLHLKNGEYVIFDGLNFFKDDFSKAIKDIKKYIISYNKKYNSSYDKLIFRIKNYNSLFKNLKCLDKNNGIYLYEI